MRSRSLICRLLGPGLAVVVVGLFVSCAAPTSKIERPDLNGTWGHAVVFGLEFVRGEKLPDGSVCVFGCTPPPEDGSDPPAPAFPKYKPEFLAKVADLRDRQVQTDSVLRCQPPGVPRIGPPGKIVQTAREVVFLYDDYSGSFFRIIPTDGRGHRTDVAPSYLGDAIGRFDGDTLIVETINFNDDTWLTDNGAFHTKDLKVIESLRRVGDTIRYQAIAYDPGVLLEPWAMAPRDMVVSEQELEESPRCEDRDLAHMVDRSHHDNPR
jgi:hypothetical protein